MRLLALVLSSLLLVAVPVSSQPQSGVCETNCQWQQGVAFTAFTDVDPAATSYALIVNGVPSSIQPVVSAAFVEFRFASGLPLGTHSFVITGTGPAGTWTTDPNTLTIVKRKVVKFKA